MKVTAGSSEFLKSDDIGRGKKLKLTMDRVELRQIGEGENAKEKYVLYFFGKSKGLVLNATNIKRITAVHGDESEKWQGQEIYIYVEPCSYQGKTVDGIRVEMPLEVVEEEDEPPF